MLNPWHMEIGTSRKLLGRDILLSIFSHSSGMKGVLTMSKLWDGVALLGIVGAQTTQGAPMFASME